MSNIDNKTPTPTPAAPAKPQPTVAELLAEVVSLKKAVATKADAPVPPKPPESQAKEIDWSKVSESEVFDLSVAIPAIEHDLPDYMNVQLVDKNYVPRWTHKLPQNLGPKLAAGYQYVTKEDLDTRYPIPLLFDGEGHYCFADVVLLKIHKSRYYPALRRNHEKTMAIHGAGKVRAAVQQQLDTQNPALANAVRRGAMSFYEDKSTEETFSGEDLSNVTL